MEEIYSHIFRLVVGILALVGVLWSALRYLVKYKVFKASHEVRQYADSKLDTIWQRVHSIEADIYDLNIALSKLKDMLKDAEKSESEKLGQGIRNISD